jgi:hypothetical protein
MVTRTLTFEDEKWELVKNAMWELYAVEIDPETGRPAYNKNQHAERCIRRLIKHDVHRWRLLAAAKTAQDGISFDEDLVS